MSGLSALLRRGCWAAALALTALPAATPARAQTGPRLQVDTTGSHEGFGLLPATGLSPAIRGRVSLRQPWSPFGVSVSEAGEVLHELSIEIDSLPPAAPGERYVVWLATPSLDSVARLGPIEVGRPVTASSGLAQMLVVVTRESGAPSERWRGPIVLRGRSRSALIQSLLNHPIFRRAEMD